jgi:hypothetical protein
VVAPLLDWAFPDLPESLHLLRADGSTVLATVPWHNDAWLKLTESEYGTLRAQLPETTWRVTPDRDTTTPDVLTDELLEHLLDLSGRGDPGPWTSYVEGRDNAASRTYLPLLVKELQRLRSQNPSG